MSFFSRFKTGLALPSLTVALTPARVFTSRLRRRYHERYRGRYRFPILLFTIDLLVVAFVLIIFGVGVWFAIWKPAPASGLQLVFSAPPITTATTLAFEANVSAQDDRLHSQVRLRWILPPGAEIVSSSLPLDARKEVLLGDIPAHETRTARLAVRLFVPPGSVRLGFQVRSGEELLSGSEIRPVVSSAARLEPLISPLHSVSDERVLILRNLGNTKLDCLRVRTDAEISRSWQTLSMSRGGDVAFAALLPHDSRWFGVSLNGSPRIVSLFCGEAELQRLILSPVEPPRETGFPSLELSPSTPGQETTAVVVSSRPLTLVVYHPFLKDAQDGVRRFEVTSGTTRIVLPLDESGVLPDVGRGSMWFAIPVRTTQGGDEIVGPLTEAPITTPFRLSAEARYYAASGGQIGVGPLPPVVDKATRYWIQWKLEPTQRDLSSFEVRAKLPSSVKWTGKTALPDGGDFIQEQDELIWRLPFLPTSSEARTAVFEVELTPTPDMRGKSPSLLESGRAQALENGSGINLRAQIPNVDTQLVHDERAQGKDRVQ